MRIACQLLIKQFTLFIFLMTGFGFQTAYGEEKFWLLVDTSESTLMVMDDDRIREKFENISIGKNGVSSFKLKGDDKTPTGTYSIAWINEKSRYRLFLGFNYPLVKHAERGFENGSIDIEDYIAIRAAIGMGKVPPQNTALGGNIGIHGLGVADPEIHRRVNWTEGCVALNNAQIDKLSRWIYKGMKVVVK